MEHGLQLNKIRQYLSEDCTYKLDLIEQNQMLVKENFMLMESCGNFTEVDKNLHRKIEKLEGVNEELYMVLEAVVKGSDNFTSSGYLKAVKVLDKYKRTKNNGSF